MPFRSIAEPEDLARLTATFDTVWAILEEQRPVDPLSVAAERERLGHIIVTLWRADPDCDLVTKAVQQFRVGGVLLTPLPGLTKPLDL
ncbi:hypothetical protein SAMN04488115_107207 [Bosea lathyri]|uniref:Uncharacterized protein n=1 Tax=Bosea lathyri TaxID=1036778 RepID=A0A1H6BG97_9HYPH|nr:hypothetical protein SAMN04488115_107207 [Bosea lathyri]